MKTSVIGSDLCARIGRPSSRRKHVFENASVRSITKEPCLCIRKYLFPRAPARALSRMSGGRRASSTPVIPHVPALPRIQRASRPLLPSPTAPHQHLRSFQALPRPREARTISSRSSSIRGVGGLSSSRRRIRSYAWNAFIAAGAFPPSSWAVTRYQ
jgi:hypothetical protein